ncbi:hypothetical protein V8C37DRAFT_372126 [Trichoderma ceciliae]
MLLPFILLSHLPFHPFLLLFLPSFISPGVGQELQRGTEQYSLCSPGHEIMMAYQDTTIAGQKTPLLCRIEV